MTTVEHPAASPAAQTPEAVASILLTQRKLQSIADSVVLFDESAEAAVQALLVMVGPIASTNFELLSTFFKAVRHRGMLLEDISVLRPHLRTWHCESKNPAFSANSFAQACKRRLDSALSVDPLEVETEWMALATPFARHDLGDCIPAAPLSTAYCAA